MRSRSRVCLDHETDQLGHGIGLHLSEHLMSAGHDGSQHQFQLLGDPFVRSTGDDPIHDVAMQGAQAVDTLLEFPTSRLGFTLLGILGQGRADRIPEFVLFARLFQQGNGSSSHGANRHADLCVGRHDDHRQRNIQLLQPLLEFDPADAEHPNIGNQATGLIGSVAFPG